MPVLPPDRTPSCNAPMCPAATAPWRDERREGEMPEQCRLGEGCWEWRGATDAEGRPMARTGLSSTTAARRVFERRFGPLEPGKVLGKLCGSLLCVRPSHHEPMTRSEVQRRAGTTRLDRQLANRLVKASSRLSVPEITEALVVSERTVRRVLADEHWTTRPQ